MAEDTVAPIAAILYSPTDRIEELMLQAARILAAEGVKVGGVLQRATGVACGMEMEDLASGECFSLSQELGSGSEACRLDTDSLAHAAIAVRRAVDAGTQIVFINKFGAQEAAGSGLRDEIGVAVMAGVPLLTAVAERFLDDWQAFTGGTSALLKPDLPSILAWWSETAARAGEH